MLAAMTVPKIGNKAPALKLKNQNGETVSLEQFKGKTVVLYFYPKDETPGCTKEACTFRDEFAGIKKKGAVILGVSPDPVEQHAKFAAKHELPFDLLADANHRVADKYGVWVEKSMYGKKFMGIERSTFVIDANGKLKAIFRKVHPTEHIAEVVAVL
ncbi:MAG: thioredoxin-dependent thiol peroxidase [Verrucomicrobiales bacterium]|jgi:peroxiredoxin Q/BCP|nr:thioredoxin-dependent thiol peroxidase [Verrucomicrobiales bacterium]